jgi:secondary thiamine-phosphate synthase enzyme
METLARASTHRHARIALPTSRATQFVDLTDRLERFVADAGIATGLLAVQTLHTTTAVVVNEHEPQLLADFEALLERLAPVGAVYRHDDDGLRTLNRIAEERPNGHAHCRALLLPSSATVSIVDGRLLLGRWQRVFLVELDGPREREIAVTALAGTTG